MAFGNTLCVIVVDVVVVVEKVPNQALCYELFATLFLALYKKDLEKRAALLRRQVLYSSATRAHKQVSSVVGRPNR